jgi:ATP synthase in type III secretion protein N
MTFMKELANLSGGEINTPSPLERFRSRIQSLDPVVRVGRVHEIVVNTLRANLPDVTRGEMCEVLCEDGRKVLGEVIAFTGNEATIACLDAVDGIALGAKVTPLGRSHSIESHPGIIGQVLDGMGRNMLSPDDRSSWALSLAPDSVPVMRQAPPAADRPPVCDQLVTGVRVIDGLNSLAIGQRIGVFAPPGCGKTTLMSQIARGAQTDIVVFALVGERGRELREFMDREISADIRSRSVFVCATSDRSPTERVRSAFTAMTIAEHFRDQGLSVLLLVDSITRLARAQREIGLMVGEPATAAGFTPSVYSLLPQIIERAGRTQQGSITAVFTVLMETEKFEDDPIASEAKSLLDGHILLSQKYVESAQFPAVDPLRSLSRVMDHIVSPEQARLAQSVRRVLSIHQEMELLIRLNEYQAGNDPVIDEALKIVPGIKAWMQQGRNEASPPEHAARDLGKILATFQNLTAKR